MVSLWDVMTLASGGAALGGALAAAKVAGYGRVEILIAVLVGSTVGILCIWFVRTVGRHAFARLDSGSSKIAGDRKGSKRVLQLIYVATFLWIGVSGELGMQAVTLAIRAVPR